MKNEKKSSSKSGGMSAGAGMAAGHGAKADKPTNKGGFGKNGNGSRSKSGGSKFLE